MKIEITSGRGIRITPDSFDKDKRQAEIIFIEDILGLRKEGDTIKLIRVNAINLSCISHLETKLEKK